MKRMTIILIVLAAVALACGQTVKVDPPTLTAPAYIVPANTDTAYTAFSTPTQTTPPAPTQTPQVWRARICENKCP